MKKLGCALRRVTHFLVVMALAFNIAFVDARPAYAMPVEVTASIPETVNFIKTVAHWVEEKAKWISDKIAWAKNYVMQKLHLSALIKSGKNAIKVGDKTNSVIAQSNASVGLGIIQNAANIQNAAAAAGKQLAVAQAANKIATDNADKVAKLCLQGTQAEIAAGDGGAANGAVLKTAPDVPPAGFRQPNTSFGAAATDRKDADGKPVVVPPDQAVSAFVKLDSMDGAAAGKGIGGAGGASGSHDYYRDLAQKYYRNINCSKGDFYGQASKVDGLCNNNDSAKMGINTRGDELLAGSGTENMLCFEDAIAGKLTLGYTGVARCAPKQTWESFYSQKGEKKAAGQPLPELSLDTSYVVRDEIVPPPLPPLSAKVLEGLKNGESGQEELLAKREAYNTQLSIAQGVFNQAIARKTPQKFGKDENKDIFKKMFKIARPNVDEKYIPDEPSFELRRNVVLAQYLRPDGIKTGAAFAGGGGAEGGPVGLELSMMKDQLESSQRIEMLLATLLANDLRAKRDDLFNAINDANAHAP